MLLAIVSLSGCYGPSEAVRQAVADGLPQSRIVDLGEAALATRTTSGEAVEILFVYQDPDDVWHTDVIGRSRGDSGANSASLVTGSGLGLGWNTFVFGTASAEVQTVRVAELDDARGGAVVDGMWVVASPEENVAIESLTIEFIGEDGKVAEEQ